MHNMCSVRGANTPALATYKWVLSAPYGSSAGATAYRASASRVTRSLFEHRRWHRVPGPKLECVH